MISSFVSSAVTSFPSSAGQVVPWKVPSAATGRTSAKPCCWPAAKSSAPNAGAMCTMPEPSSAVTKVPVTTIPWARSSGSGTTSSGRV